MPRKPPRDDGPFVEDAVPPRLPVRGGSVATIPEASMEKMRVCLKAANLRAQHKTWRSIASELGLANATEAFDAAQKGLALQPVEDLRALRRMAELRFDRLAREALKVIADPGPMVSQGKVMYNDATGEPYPDNAVRVSALELWRKVQADWRKFDGLDAPKRSVTHIEVADMRARSAELRRELGLGDDDGLAGVREPLPRGPAPMLPGMVLSPED